MSFIEFKYSNCFSKINNYKNYLNLLKNSKELDSIIGSSNFLKIINNYDEINKVKKLCTDLLGERKKPFKKFCIFGTGGSSLGAQTLINLLPGKNKETIIFFDNIDPIIFNERLDKIDILNTCFIVISKSGKTPETLSQFSALLTKCEERGIDIGKIKKNFILITENSKNPLSSIGKEYDLLLIEHDKNIGGRFSIFSIVGLLPAYLAGVDIEKFIKGAKISLSDALEKNTIFHIEGASLTSCLYQEKNMNINVLLTYADSLKAFGSWYRQLWAESLGKNRLGSTPLHAVGTLDQHSQLQLYLDGPKDKFFTIIKSNFADQGAIMHNILGKFDASYLSNKSMGDLMHAEQNATIQTLINKNLPVREIFINKINPESLGSLIVHYFLEVIGVGIILGIDIFNQPAVDEGKILTKNYLS
ncbi:MAG: glucose-6-phosphate isomerase [Pelagibacteraceae bacterium]|nr:glucose-6-phosphate isomerase [Pelagibacteraceae bacterium]PPR50833.1 MAG: Glucose-6-phosphate isomerase [Alphaproteobacteria bacterium MarineAlpha5_Bin10]|tara:strand:+ start:6279 stop:7529 length:1251 start_codon:yes stop_codon:yes gene_type:complete